MSTLSSLLYTSFTFVEPTKVVYDRGLVKACRQFCNQLISAQGISIHNRHNFLEDVYSFAYSALVQSRFNFFFEDKKLVNVPDIHHGVYAVIQEHISLITDRFSLKVSETHLSILTLIVKKHILRNSYGSTRKKLYVVTNSAENKVGYFVELLKAHFNVDILGIVNTNELHRLSGQNYDLILTFTNKISSYLEHYQLQCIKVNFNLQKEDFDRLRAAGLSHVREKIPVDQFRKEISGLSEGALEEWLTNRYSDYFI